MLLGTLIDQLSDEMVALQTLIDLQDLSVLARLNLVAEDHGLTLGETIIKAINTFSSNANPDSWAQLMSKLNSADDPGSVALKHILEEVFPK